MVSIRDPHGHILEFLDRSRYFFQVATQLHSQGWVDPVPDPLLLRKSYSIIMVTLKLCRNKFELKMLLNFYCRTLVEKHSLMWAFLTAQYLASLIQHYITLHSLDPELVEMAVERGICHINTYTIQYIHIYLQYTYTINTVQPKFSHKNTEKNTMTLHNAI
jgi:hypothetical protein